MAETVTVIDKCIDWITSTQKKGNILRHLYLSKHHMVSLPFTYSPRSLFIYLGVLDRLSVNKTIHNGSFYHILAF